MQGRIEQVAGILLLIMIILAILLLLLVLDGCRTAEATCCPMTWQRARTRPSGRRMPDHTCCEVVNAFVPGSWLEFRLLGADSKSCPGIRCPTRGDVGRELP